MRRLRVAIGLALVLAAPLYPATSQGQSFWDNFLRSPAAARPAATPCVLDKCLNGAAQKPQAAQPSPTSAPPQSAGMVAPGNFDFYLLTLSWSPGFCDR